MPRRNYLITYDVADDKRRNKLFVFLQGQGDHAQYSVFFCELSPTELAIARSTISGIIQHREDQVLILDLGPEEKSMEKSLEVLGCPYQPLTRILVV